MVCPHSSSSSHRTDDEMRSGLRAQLAALRPVEVVLPSSGLSATTRKVLMGTLRNPRVNELPPGDGFWSAQNTLAELDKAAYFGGECHVKLLRTNLCEGLMSGFYGNSRLTGLCPSIAFMQS